MALNNRLVVHLAARGARGAIDGIAAPDDPLRAVKLAAFAAALVAGWIFILWTNEFHITAPAVIACLGYLAVVATILNFWRVGVSAATSDDETGAWGRPIGPKVELEKEKRTLLKAIKEAEFDLAMGKLSKGDADGLIQQYRVRAIEVIKELDRAGDADLSPKEQIEREVKARRELLAREQKAKPNEREPADAKPADAKPADAKRDDAAPAETAPADAAPAETAPADAAPADAAPADAAPAEAKS